MRQGIVFHEVEQGSPEWLALRMGRVTGSSVAEMLVDGITEKGKRLLEEPKRLLKNQRARKEPDHAEIARLTDHIADIERKHFDFGAGAWSLIYQLAGEIVTGEMPTDFGNYWTDRGKEMEQQANEAYMEETFYQTNRVGFISWGKYAGCSPDWAVDERRGAEAKCLSAREHFRFCHARAKAIASGLPLIQYIEKEYYAQVQWCLFVTGFEVWDYVHYHPGAGAWELVIDEIHPDLEMHAIFSERLGLLTTRVEEIVNMATQPKYATI